MAPLSKEDVVTVSPDSAAAGTSNAPRLDDTASRPQPVALEVPVTVNGARTVEGTDKREPFSETTKTVLVFGHGAVIRLASPVAPGQLLFLTNEKTKKEVVCQVVKSKNYRSVSGYVELEFTEPVVGFWGMRFPTDRVAPPVSSPALTAPAISKPAPAASVPPAPKAVAPVLPPPPKVSEIKPTQPAVATPSPQSLASALSGLLGSANPAVASAAPSAPQETRPEVSEAARKSEELKLQAARLQEQLSSLLFSANASANAPVAPAPASGTEAKSASSLTAQVLEIAKSEPAPAKPNLPVPNLPAKVVPPPIKSSLDTEEVKIPSWLEPLARNASAPVSTQDLVEREKAKHAAEHAATEEHAAQPVAVSDAEPVVSDSEPPAIGNLLPLDEDVLLHDHQSSGSGRGFRFAIVAAMVLLAAGGAWYFLRPTSPVQRANAPVTSSPETQTNAATPEISANPPAVQPAVQQPAAPSSLAAREPVRDSAPSQPVFTAPPARSSANPRSAVRDTTRESGTTIPAAETERISRSAPAAQPEPKKPAIGEVHLASPSVNRRSNAQEDGTAAPTLSSGAAVPNVGLDSGLAAGDKQPSAPPMPVPVGGDVTPAKLLNSVSPMYPMLAKNQHISGDVVIDALIDANGRVTTMKVISGPALLHQAAMDALRQWKYRPATLDGNAVPMHLTVKLQFRLQ